MWESRIFGLVDELYGDSRRSSRQVYSSAREAPSQRSRDRQRLSADRRSIGVRAHLRLAYVRGVDAQFAGPVPLRDVPAGAQGESGQRTVLPDRAGPSASRSHAPVHARSLLATPSQTPLVARSRDDRIGRFRRRELRLRRGYRGTPCRRLLGGPRGVRRLRGPVGAGKSTVISLLTRMHEPTDGEIRANGVSIGEMDIDEWRDHIAVVEQDPYIFDDTLEYNLTIADRDASWEEVERVCEIAQVDEFLDDLPDGYETQVGDDGVRPRADRNSASPSPGTARRRGRVVAGRGDERSGLEPGARRSSRDRDDGPGVSRRHRRPSVDHGPER